MKISLALLVPFFTIGCDNTNKKVDEKKTMEKTAEPLEKTPNEEIKIGNQIWATKNLSVASFRNGDAITEVKNNSDWEKAGDNKQPAWCHYNNDPTNDAKYGKLYNWYAVNDPRGLAPQGWHIPNDAEWTSLINNLGGEDLSGIQMKSEDGWKEGGAMLGGGNNSSGFSGVPGGTRSYDGTFEDIGAKGFYWSSSRNESPNGAWYRLLSYDLVQTPRRSTNQLEGLSVRCLKD